MDTEVESGDRKGRPNYSSEFKHQLAVAACDPSVSVSKLAHDHGINTNMLFKWRRDLRAGLLTGLTTEDTRLLPVVLKTSSPAGKPASGAPRVSDIEITISDATVRVCVGMDAALLLLVPQSMRA
ncbi:IS66-like element accessory protein TnpA [Janthinobacterium lividum]|uniref:IS66-like element accessory protein TnpA n=1 Tax=Janthinobacterium lividum TaxID=29581 RepID=UPI001FD5CB21|nr:transposase [Janthinobacterium lividum]